MKASELVQQFVDAAPYIVRMRDRHWVLWLDRDLPLAMSAEIAQEISLLKILGARLSIILDNGVDKMGPLSESQMRDIAQADALAQSRWLNLLSRGWVGLPDKKFRISAVTGNVVIGRRVGVVNGVDYERSGRVRTIDSERIGDLLSDGNIVVQTGSVPGMTGLELCLPSADLAVEYALQTSADKVIYISARMPEIDLPAEWAPVDLESSKADALARPAIVLAMQKAMQKGLERVHLVDGNQRGSLLAELLTRKGHGLLVGQSAAAVIEQATVQDISQLAALISHFEPNGELAARSRALIEASIEDFCLLKTDGRLVGCGAVRVQSDDAVCVFESVAVHPDFQSQGLGVTLMQALQNNARNAGCRQAYVLTTSAQDWFADLGFKPCAQTDVPECVRTVLDPKRNSSVLVKSLDISERLPD